MKSCRELGKVDDLQRTWNLFSGGVPVATFLVDSCFQKCNRLQLATRELVWYKIFYLHVSKLILENPRQIVLNTCKYLLKYDLSRLSNPVQESKS